MASQSQTCHETTSRGPGIPFMASRLVTPLTSLHTIALDGTWSEQGNELVAQGLPATSQEEFWSIPTRPCSPLAHYVNALFVAAWKAPLPMENR